MPYLLLSYERYKETVKSSE